MRGCISDKCKNKRIKFSKFCRVCLQNLLNRSQPTNNGKKLNLKQFKNVIEFGSKSISLCSTFDCFRLKISGKSHCKKCQDRIKTIKRRAKIIETKLKRGIYEFSEHLMIISAIEEWPLIEDYFDI